MPGWPEVMVAARNGTLSRALRELFSGLLFLLPFSAFSAFHVILYLYNFMANSHDGHVITPAS